MDAPGRMESHPETFGNVMQWIRLVFVGLGQHWQPLKACLKRMQRVHEEGTLCLTGGNELHNLRFYIAQVKQYKQWLGPHHVVMDTSVASASVISLARNKSATTDEIMRSAAGVI